MHVLSFLFNLFLITAEGSSSQLVSLYYRIQSKEILNNHMLVIDSSGNV